MREKFRMGVAALAKRRQENSQIGAANEMSPRMLPLKSDIIFKMVFGDTRNNSSLRSFLAAALNIPEAELEEIEVIDTHLERDHPDDKLGILDVRVLTASGRRIDVEIQLYEYALMPERITFYTCKNLTSQITSGQDYGDIRLSITIVILDFNLLKDSPSYHHIFRLYDKLNNVQFTDVR
ncbi:MAG: Rpn family recombination-promoting nuclease/putative transposase [Synergistaceae bacterium]|nr:Rpn family recombination-promoting nuclease/putative transposase [Synergistaceae bacterium]